MSERLPYTPDRPPVTAPINQHVAVFSAYAYPLSSHTPRKAPLETHMVQGQRGIETPIFWGWGLSRIEPQLSEKVIALFHPRMRDEIARWDSYFRERLPCTRRGQNLTAEARSPIT